ncbi:MAG: hypothetical protein PVF83_06050 [Anaerolineales bacterium]
MRNLSPKEISKKAKPLYEGHLSADVLDEVETFCYRDRPMQEDHLDKKIAIVNVDNSPCGDGNICTAILDVLLDSAELPSCADIIDCSRGGLLRGFLSQDYRYVWVVDTAYMGLSPGAWQCFTPMRGISYSMDRQSSMRMHYADISEAIAFGIALDIELPYIEIYYIQPLPLEGAQGVGAPVKKVALEVCDLILDGLKRRIIEHGEDFGC